jgi:hypothetical protein
MIHGYPTNGEWRNFFIQFIRAAAHKPKAVSAWHFATVNRVEVREQITCEVACVYMPLTRS